ncbi:hypothetical protein ILP97_41800 [Amycolatopsis sp. H6(2020)]|nr:hypothetical protein [Amycolatopsis sp. H6(2020)]
MSDIATRTGAVRPICRVGNLLIDFYEWLPRIVAECVPDPAPRAVEDGFSPGFRFPELDERVRMFLAAASVTWRPLAEYGGRRLTLLDLTGNPGTNTTKTFPSLLIVARAVEHIRRTGEPVLIFSPTSANKGTALRDAVLRALDCGLASPEQLRIAILAPRSCLAKLRATRLSQDPRLRALNPLFVYQGDQPETVKTLGRDFVREYGASLRAQTGLNTWYTLDLRNYVIADTARAFFENQVDPVTGPRLHAHAVSSAFGMLGYHHGRAVLEAAGLADVTSRPATLLVQHLGAPDMVVHLRWGGFATDEVPGYVRDPRTSLYHQEEDPRFPEVTHDPAEVLDPTFYTHRPPTAPAMDAIITEFGGDGIVVSLAECLARYPYLRTLTHLLPADFRELREWSLVMALTGTLNAIDRGLAGDCHDIVVHASGSYSSSDYAPVTDEMVTWVRSTVDLAAGLVPGR